MVSDVNSCSTSLKSFYRKQYHTHTHMLETMGKVYWNSKHVGNYYMKQIIKISSGYLTYLAAETSKISAPSNLYQQISLKVNLRL